MQELSGKISDRIRSGNVPEDAVRADRIELNPSPRPESIRNAEGHGMGSGAIRNGER